MGEYLSMLLGSSNKDSLVILDEPYISLSFNKLEHISGSDSLLISIQRDPRDQFLNARRYSYQFVLKSITEFIQWFKAQKCLLDKARGGTERRLDLNFEDLVLNYEETTAKIRRFVGEDLINVDYQFEHFDPQISAKNLRQYESEHNYRNDILLIEKGLSEYLYWVLGS